MQILTTQLATLRARGLLRVEVLPVNYISLDRSVNPSVPQFPCGNDKELTKSVKVHGTMVNILVSFQKKKKVNSIAISDTTITTVPLTKGSSSPFSGKRLSSFQNCLRGKMRHHRGNRKGAN